MINCIKSWLCLQQNESIVPWNHEQPEFVPWFESSWLNIFSPSINLFTFISIPNYKIVQQQSLVCIPGRDQCFFFHYQFKPEPWLTKTSFLVLLDYICVLRVAILYKLWHEKQVKETQVFILMTWEELMSFHDNSDLIIIFETLTYISNLRFHKFNNEGTM